MARPRAEVRPGEVRSGASLYPGSLARRMHQLVAELPGMRVTTGEVAAELQLSSQQAGAHLRRLMERRLILAEGGGGRGHDRQWYVPE